MTPSAAVFTTHFLTSYHDARKRSDKDEWSRVWAGDGSWSKLMIWPDDALIRLVAQKLGLKCYPRQPLHLDAVFHANEDPLSWFPMRVAIEHENNPRTFIEEVQKLLSVRCALKVGITYALINHIRDDQKSLEGYRSEIAGVIRQQFTPIASLVGEDPNTEYLFLVGSEDEQKELRW